MQLSRRFAGCEALAILGDVNASTQAVAEQLSKMFPDSKMVATKTADKSFSVYVSNQREKAAKEMGIPYEGRGKATASSTQPSGLTLKGVAASNVDPAALAEAIALIKRAGGVDEAKAVVDRYNGLVKAVGAENAKKAVEFM